MTMWADEPEEDEEHDEDDEPQEELMGMMSEFTPPPVDAEFLLAWISRWQGT